MDENYISIIALIVSGISILVTILVAIYSVRKSVRISQSQLKKDIFLELFQNKMVKEYPQAVKNLKKSKKDLMENCDCLERLNVELLDSLAYYKVVENRFYVKLKVHLDNIDDSVVCMMHDIEDKKEDHSRHLKKVEKSYMNLIKTLHKFYMNV